MSVATKETCECINTCDVERSVNDAERHYIRYEMTASNAVAFSEGDEDDGESEAWFDLKQKC